MMTMIMQRIATLLIILVAAAEEAHSQQQQQQYQLRGTTTTKRQLQSERPERAASNRPSRPETSRPSRPTSSSRPNIPEREPETIESVAEKVEENDGEKYNTTEITSDGRGDATTVTSIGDTTPPETENVETKEETSNGGGSTDEAQSVGDSDGDDTDNTSGAGETDSDYENLESDSQVNNEASDSDAADSVGIFDGALSGVDLYYYNEDMALNAALDQPPAQNNDPYPLPSLPSGIGAGSSGGLSLGGGFSAGGGGGLFGDSVPRPSGSLDGFTGPTRPSTSFGSGGYAGARFGSGGW